MSFPRFNLEHFENSSGVERKKRSEALDKICIETGFLIIEGHGVPKKVINEQWDIVSKFFSSPLDIKREVRVPYSGYPYGWIGPDQEALAASKGEETPPDLKESFNGGPLNIPKNIKDPAAYEFCYQPSLWPQIDGFREIWESYYSEMESLAKRIMVAFAEALVLESSYFDSFINNPISALRALYYPETKDIIIDKQQRAGAHTDYGSLTILLPQTGTTGLQIKKKNTWIDVPAPQDCFVINIGDLMELWTAGRWVSTLHRVVAKPNQSSRKSLAYFHQPDWEAIIKPINASFSEKVVSGPYLMEKFKSTNL
jgi:isopenicillin N synthase-like dioxygenase|tara:strand:- start:75 stop:1010 length:936 start_codon:yes stop_codon:yes gene_type:complete